MPTFLEEDMLQDIFTNSPTPSHSSMEYLRNGLKYLGIHQVGIGILVFWSNICIAFKGILA
jgi:hypothetical protein